MDRKYWSYHIGPLHYEPTFSQRFLGGNVIYRLYFYEEDGKSYEFFSGIFLGNRISGQRYTDIKDSTLRICLSHLSYGENAVPHTAVQFADEVKPYAKVRDRVANAVRNYLMKCKSDWAKEQAKRKNEEDARKKNMKRIACHGWIILLNHKGY